MTRTFCDGCGKEIAGNNRRYNFHYLTHIRPENRLKCHVVVVDGETHSFSGREDQEDVCIKCYNQIMGAAYAKFASLKKQIKLCDGNCGMNYCDENGCIDRKRILVPVEDLPPSM